jgi:hypothetical protein
MKLFIRSLLYNIIICSTIFSQFTLQHELLFKGNEKPLVGFLNKNGSLFVVITKDSSAGKIAITFYDENTKTEVFRNVVDEKQFKYLASSNDGRYFVYVLNTTVVIIDTHNFSSVKTIKPNINVDQEIGVISFSQDGSKLIITLDNERIEIWDVHKLAISKTFATPDLLVLKSLLTKDLKLITVFSNGLVRLYNAQSGVIIHEFGMGRVKFNTPLIISPDGSRIVFAPPNVSKPIIVNSLTGHKSYDRAPSSRNIIESLVFNKDFSKIFSLDKNNIIKIWDAITGIHNKTIAVQQPILRVFLEHGDQGLLLTTPVEGELQLLQFPLMTVLQKKKVHQTAIKAVDIAQGQNKFIVLTMDKDSVKIWHYKAEFSKVMLQQAIKKQYTDIIIEQE